MRMTPEEHHAIVQAVRAQDAAAQIYLYGSRADHQAFGGDIDILL
jgi:predicted nucleotidyltransferase